MFLDHFIGIFSHPMSNLFPKTFSNAVCAAKVNSTVTKEIYVVCPNDTCNALYKIHINFVRNCHITNFVDQHWGMTPIYLMDGKYGDHTKYFNLFLPLQPLKICFNP